MNRDQTYDYWAFLVAMVYTQPELIVVEPDDEEPEYEMLVSECYTESA